MDEVVVSDSDDVPKKILEQFITDGFEIAVSRHASPQQRVSEILYRKKLYRVLVLNGYSHIVDGTMVDQLETFTKKGSNLTAYTNKSVFRNACLLDHTVVDALCTKNQLPLPPNKFHCIQRQTEYPVACDIVRSTAEFWPLDDSFWYTAPV